jgi:HlyD family secretion protein
LINAPKKVVAHADGKLTKIDAVENQTVKTGQTIGYIESIADPFSVNFLKRLVDTVDFLLNSEKVERIPKLNSAQIVNEYKIEQLGELQSYYQVFVRELSIFKDFLSDGLYVRKKDLLLIELQNNRKLYSYLSDQKTLLSQDLYLSKESFEANESLAIYKVISPLDLRNEKSKLLAKKMTLPQIDAALISNKNQENEIRKQISELESQTKIQKGVFAQAVQTLKSQIEAWEYKYLLKSPVSGKISYVGFIQQNQEVKINQLLFYVEPEDADFFVEILIPQYNFGKVKIGQDVNLKFDAYPSQQYGMVTGKIDFISKIPSDSGYLAKVILPNGLKTNYKLILPFYNDLKASVEIVTDKTRLLERFYKGILKNF